MTDSPVVPDAFQSIDEAAAALAAFDDKYWYPNYGQGTPTIRRTLLQLFASVFAFDPANATEETTTLLAGTFIEHALRLAAASGVSLQQMLQERALTITRLWEAELGGWFEDRWLRKSITADWPSVTQLLQQVGEIAILADDQKPVDQRKVMFALNELMAFPMVYLPHKPYESKELMAPFAKRLRVLYEQHEPKAEATA